MNRAEVGGSVKSGRKLLISQVSVFLVKISYWAAEDNSLNTNYYKINIKPRISAVFHLTQLTINRREIEHHQTL